MKLIKLKCEGCGATLNVNEELKKISCNYCGMEFIADDGSVTHIYKKIDEAKIKEIEIKNEINKRELEYKEREEKRAIKITLICFGLAILCILLGII